MAGTEVVAAVLVVAAGVAGALFEPPLAGAAGPLALALELANAQDSCAPFRFIAAMEGFELSLGMLDTTTDLDYAIHAAVDLTRSEHDAFHGQLAGISVEMQASAATLLSAITLTEKRLDKAWARVTEQDYATLASEPIGSPVAMAILDKVDRPQVLSAACALVTVIDTVVATLSAVPVGSPSIQLTSSSCAPPPVVVPIGSGDPVLVIGGTGCDEYVFSSTTVSLDPMGDDVYSNNPGTAIGGLVPKVAVALDLDGNDRWNTQHAAANTKAVGIVTDHGGDDTYLSTGFEATGWNTGVGYLRDFSGVDNYQCSDNCQGAGRVSGIGILWDSVGNDDYLKSGHTGQGNGKINGIGILLDQDGNDYYIASSGAQGFATDSGTGILVDRNGTDTYNVSWSNFGRATHDPANPATMVFLDMNGDDDYQRRADDGVPPDSRDAGSGTPPLPNPYRWGPGQTGTFYIRGMDCEAPVEVCLQQL